MIELLDYEKKHIDYLLNNAHEGTLFLKRDSTFPIDKPCRTVLVGSGARQTIKGGTGSGDVASRFFSNFEDGLEKAGFEITSKDWLDKYTEFKKSTWKSFVRFTKKRAWKTGFFPGVYSMGFFEEEKNYTFDVTAGGELCVYVISRNSGEGNDRRNIKGDVKLSDREVFDILSLNKKFNKFLLVLNVGGVIDLTPILGDVNNILYISQLGVVTGDILPKIILGEVNPCGKLTTTWARPEDYPYFEEFGTLHDTYYKEGIYVGYRYFDSIKKEPYFPFGYGKSYTDFEITDQSIEVVGKIVTVKASVKNIGEYAGKEVFEVYLSSPQNNLNKPYQTLVTYAKTSLLEKGQFEQVSASFNLDDVASYDSIKQAYVLEKGNYIVRAGNSSRDTKALGYLKVDSDIIVKQCENKIGESGFEDYKIALEDEDISGLECIKIDASAFTTNKVVYKKDEYIHPFVRDLTDEELMLITLGAHKTVFGSVVGDSAANLAGGAGETTLAVSALKQSLTMADGPQGLRLWQTYGKDEKGTYQVSLDPMFEKMFYFLPKFVSHFMAPPKNRHGKVYHQYTTAIPIGTSLAMSFNDDYLYEIGKIIGEEMEMFNVNLWLAPALNIHRNILCGRNFEYYSEDPYLSGRTASFVTKGVQSNKKRGVTIKHFCCNNQELNRNNNNTHVSERALREIYIKGFEYCIKYASPKAIMTSYNLINGTHTSELYGLVNDILRCEWKYEGLVMTDWITSGLSWCLTKKYPAPYADNNILAGNDLTMSGSKSDEKYIRKALKKGKLTRKDLEVSASRIYRSIDNISNEN